jgi:hypothetical protein
VVATTEEKEMNKPITPKEMEDWVGGTWDRCQKEAWGEPMNRDDIIAMAREAGLLAEDEAWVSPHQEAIERFAALVAAAEREACAKACEQRAKDYGYETDFYAAEHVSEARYCAAAIRARGEK